MNPKPGPAELRLRTVLVLFVLLLLLPADGTAQRIRDIPATLMQLVFPEADRFAEHEGIPPVFTAWRTDSASGQEELVGYVFHTADVPPERRGYSGPIEALVGMDLQGRLTGVRVLDYWESLTSSMGDFLRRRGVQEQFRGKHIREPFQARRDVEAVSRATISTEALAMGARDAARRVAAAYLSVALVPDLPANVDVEELDWLELRQRGVVTPMVVTGPNGAAMEVTFAYMENDSFAVGLVGDEALAMSKRAWESVTGSEGHLLFYGLDGPDVRLFGREGWALVQGGDTIPVDPNAIRAFGLASGGMLDAQVIASGVMILDAALDVTRTFRIVYELPESGPPFSVEYRSEFIRRAAAEARAARNSTLPLETPIATDPQTVSDAATEPTRSPVSAPSAEPDTEAITSDPIPEAEPSLPTTDTASVATPSLAPTPSAEFDSLGATAPLGEAGPDGPSTNSMDLFVEETSESVLARTLSNTSWGRVALVSGLWLLAIGALLTKSGMLRWVTLAGTLFLLGFFDGGFLSVSHITSAIWVGVGVFLSDLPLLLMVVFTVVTTLIWGRVFCGYLCPFGALQDLLDRFVPERFKQELPTAVHRRSLLIKYAVLMFIVGAAVFADQLSVYAYFEPFGTVFFGSRSVVLWTIAGLLLIASAIIPRFYCRYACPLGAALALGSLVSLRRIPRVEQCSPCRVCEHACPTGAISGPTIDFKECVRCNDCEIKLSERAGVCRHDAAEVRQRLVQVQDRRRAGAAS